MQCDDGCGDCCGIVPANDKEFDRILDFIEEKNIVPLKQGVTCPFYQSGKCAIYPVRPIMCQVFGHSTKLECSRGYNVNIPDRKIRRAIDRDLRKNSKEALEGKAAEQTLHDFLSKE